MKLPFFILLGAICPSAVPQASADDISQMSIKEVMRHAMTKKLAKTVISKKATEEEEKRLVELLARLKELEPPTGDASSWKKLTAELFDSAKEVAEGKASHKKLAKAANCSACHKVHRPR